MPSDTPRDQVAFPLCDTLLAEADRLLAHHRNGQSIMTLALALEAALASTLSIMLMRLPSEQKKHEAAEIQMLSKRYMSTIGSMPLGSLRNVMINVLTRQLRANTIPEALQIVEQARRFTSTLPPPEQLAAIKDTRTRSIAEALRDLSIIDLRNTVMHQAKEPADREVKEQRDAVSNLVRDLVVLVSETYRAR